MALPRYIVNMEESVEFLIPDFDNEDIEPIYETGIQRTKGLYIQTTSEKATFEITWKPLTDVRITGIKVSIEEESQWEKDTIDIVIGKDNVFRNVNIKNNFTMYKNFRIYRPVKQGEEVKILYHNQEMSEKAVWLDIDYVGEAFLGYVRILFHDEEDNQIEPPSILYTSTGRYVILSKKIEGYRLDGAYFQYVEITPENIEQIKEVVFKYYPI